MSGLPATFLRDLGAGWDCQPGVTELYLHRVCCTQTVMSQGAFTTYRKTYFSRRYCANCKADCPESEFVELNGEPHERADRR